MKENQMVYENIVSKDEKKIKSTEELYNYIKVSTPSSWLLLISIVVLVVGAIVWSIFGKIECIVPTTVRVEDRKAICYIKETDIEYVKINMDVKFGSYVAKIVNINEKEKDYYICELGATSLPKDEFYEGKVILESHRPISFITN